MKDEIKEILDEYITDKDWIVIATNVLKYLKDYITNLQEENERYKKIFEGKERFSKIMPDDTDFIILLKADYDRQQEDIELGLIDYKSRNEKAIKLLKEAGCYDEETKTFCDDVWEELPKLLNILNGDKNDK